jgi:hypothetical protein
MPSGAKAGPGECSLSGTGGSRLQSTTSPRVRKVIRTAVDYSRLPTVLVTRFHFLDWMVPAQFQSWTPDCRQPRTVRKTAPKTFF